MRFMVYQRDPLSLLYDGDATQLLDRLYAARLAGGVARTIAYVASPPLAERDDYDGSLTVQERAFTRALYWNLKQRRPRRSLQFRWSDETIPRLGRPVTLSFFTASAARRHAEQQPPRELWSENPELRSAGRQ